jgi:hypothetical protein
LVRFHPQRRASSAPVISIPPPAYRRSHASASSSANTLSHVEIGLSQGNG